MAKANDGLFSTDGHAQEVTRKARLANAIERKQAMVRYKATVRIARDDCATFCELMLRDEETGAPIQNAPFHDEWHEAADSGSNMVIWAHPESGKTQQFCVGRIIWMLGRNPRLRFAVLSATMDQGKAIISAIKGYIEKSPVVHDVFPGLKPGKQWAAHAIEVKRPYVIKDPSVQAFGTDQGAIQGKRLDGLFCDDVLTEENTRTQYQREKLDKWVRSSAFSRLSKRAFIYFLANAWHPDDMAHRLAKMQGWKVIRRPVLDENGQSTWPERWPLWRIEKWRNEVLGPLEFARQMLCQARDESAARFKAEWLDKCKARGKGQGLIHALRSVPEGFRVFTGVDLAVSQKQHADRSVFFTICVHPNGDRQVLDVTSGRMTGPDVIDKLVEIHHRYHGIFIVEHVAAQDYILQFARKMTNVPVKPLTTTGQKKWSVQFGIESLAVEFSNGKWIIPCDDAGVMAPEVDAWVNEILYYDPRAHTGDRMMASWFAREGSRETPKKIEFGRLNLMRR